MGYGLDALFFIFQLFLNVNRADQEPLPADYADYTDFFNSWKALVI